MTSSPHSCADNARSSFIPTADGSSLFRLLRDQEPRLAQLQAGPIDASGTWHFRIHEPARANRVAWGKLAYDYSDIHQVIARMLQDQQAVFAAALGIRHIAVELLPERRTMQHS